MSGYELPCFDCEHSDMSCGEITCTIEKRAVHLLDECPLGLDI